MRTSVAITAFTVAMLSTACSYAASTQVLLDSFGSTPAFQPDTPVTSASVPMADDQEASAFSLGRTSHSADYAYTNDVEIGGSSVNYVVDRTLNTTITSLSGTRANGGSSAISITPGGLLITDNRRTESWSTADYTFGSPTSPSSLLHDLAALPQITYYELSFSLDASSKWASVSSFAATAAWGGSPASAFVARPSSGGKGTLYTVKLAAPATPANELTLGFGSGAGFSAYVNNLTLSAVQSSGAFLVPEPASVTALGLGLIALGWSRRRRSA